MIKLINKEFEKIPTSDFGQVDLIIADPPDNIGLKYDNFIDKKSISKYTENLYIWIDKMANITKGPIFLTFNEKWTNIIENIIQEIKIPLIQRLQWYFKFGQDQTHNHKYALCYRPIYWLNSDYILPTQIKIPSARQIKYKDKRASKSGKLPSNIWEIPRICGTHKERRKHCPNQLPEKLVERIIKGHCRPHGCVLDPFLGSGTTAIICQKLGLNCIGIDISNTYIKRAIEILGRINCDF